MSYALSIDPGIRGVGAALWFGSKLVAAAYVKNPEAKGGGAAECAAMARAVVGWCWMRAADSKRLGIRNLVLEWPRTYAGRSKKGDTNDLFPLAGVDSAIAVLHPESVITQYTPQDWKGTTSKPEKADGSEPYVIAERVQGRLSAEEKPLVEWPSVVKLTWDVADAIGIGMKFNGRLKLKKVYPRD